VLAELAECILTPCPAPARKLGYLKEAVAIGARFRRQRLAWRSHLENSRSVILEAAHACSAHGRALILGSGSLLDIPIEELAAMFGQVVLADLVHPLGARWRVRSLQNVSMDTVDLTGTVVEAARGIMPAPAPPPRYLDQQWDLTVSANILSQLPLLPVKRLETTGAYSPGDLNIFARDIQVKHLAWMDSLPGTICLVTDTSWLDGDVETNPIPGIKLPQPTRAWTWHIAPRPEVHTDRDVTHTVSAFVRPASLR